MRRALAAAAAALLAPLATATVAPPAAAAEAAPRGAVYYTVGVLEPDRLASAWLIRRHVDPAARVLLLPEGAAPPAGGIAFDLPGARWSRRASQSTYEVILAERGIDDPALVAIGRLIRAGELAYWMLQPGSPAERFDRAMKAFALDDDAPAAFAYLDRVHRAGGEVP